ncbi:MAG: LamG domain-containing protein [Phycisphaeraceae bacterium]|nr:LamG domain-containing protein [Phycisphaeraceae bacterium]
MSKAIIQQKTGVLAAIVLGLAGISAQAAVLAEWNFDSLAGGTTVEDQVAGTDLVVTGSVSLVASGAGPGGGFGNAAQVGNSSGDYLLGPTDALGFGSSAFTVAGWIAPNSGNAASLYRMVVENGSHNNGGYNVWIGPSNKSWRGKLGFDLKGSTNITVQSNARIDDNNWHWFAVVSDGSTASMYVDGVKQTATAAVTGTTATPPSGFAFSVGDGFDGDLDQITIHSTALTGTIDGSSMLTGGELYDLWQQSIPEPTGLALLSIGGLLALKRRV